MNFTEKERQMFEQTYERLRERVTLLQNDPKSMAYIAEHPHMKKRFETMAAMSREELMAEIETDYMLFDGC